MYIEIPEPTPEQKKRHLQEATEMARRSRAVHIEDMERELKSIDKQIAGLTEKREELAKEVAGARRFDAFMLAGPQRESIIVNRGV